MGCWARDRQWVRAYKEPHPHFVTVITSVVHCVELVLLGALAGVLLKVVYERCLQSLVIMLAWGGRPNCRHYFFNPDAEEGQRHWAI